MSTDVCTLEGGCGVCGRHENRLITMPRAGQCYCRSEIEYKTRKTHTHKEKIHTYTHKEKKNLKTWPNSTACETKTPARRVVLLTAYQAHQIARSHGWVRRVMHPNAAWRARKYTTLRWSSFGSPITTSGFADACCRTTPQYRPSNPQ